MNKLVKLGLSAASSALLMAGMAASAFAQTTLTIDGNGVGSSNEIKVKEQCKTKITQISKTDVKLNVNAKSNTGGNTISGTTGDGNVMIDTGAASTLVDLTVTGGDNTATLPDCCCSEPEGLTVDIKDNGVGSTNEVKSKKKAKQEVEQKSKTKVRARVRARTRTGNNEILDTTGNGDVDVKTDDATIEVTGDVTGGGNTL